MPTLRAPVVLVLFLLADPASADDTLCLATFNCEFLIRSKVHVKFGLDFDAKNWTPAQKMEWEQAGFRDARFNEAAKTVAQVIHKINADVIALCEVGNDADVAELRQEVALLGLDYPHSAVCDSSDTVTGQHVAVLSKRPLASIVKTIPGREGYDKELDDPETEDETGVSKGMQVVFEAA